MFKIPKLPYAYNALEPHIDAKTMEIHHTKHHQAYCDKANSALTGSEWEGKEPCEILPNITQLPENIRAAAQNNVGGVCNHNFFWLILSPEGGGAPNGKLASAIDETFGSLESFKEKFNTAAASQFGSGWAWLVLKNNKLEVISTANQDSPLSIGYTRVLGLDVWEHAYYLNYQNRRPDYTTAFWNVINWSQAEEWFENGGV